MVELGTDGDRAFLIDLFDGPRLVSPTERGAEIQEGAKELLGLSSNFYDGAASAVRVPPNGLTAVAIALDPLYKLKPNTLYTAVVRQPVRPGKKYVILYGASVRFRTPAGTAK